ncbi:hypothetical protein JZ751_025390 [Albula glossodonta]|uniref:Uncharacterized protein n=1 Tax=Albula glossodonta TaxID=121402 RepID=A0A8T2NID6_9TELE|nr:hypothetical protein JZ751_025390 [Albula glossodonta]
MTSRDKSICSSPPTAPSRRDESPELPLSELNPRDKSAEFLKPELNSRDESPGLPPPEINLGCNSTGSSPPTPISDRDKSPDSPLPGLNSRAESPESPRPLITYKSRSTRSPPLTPLSSRTRSPQSPPFELSPTSLLMGSPQRPTSPETLLSVRSPRPAHPSSETHSVLAKPPLSPSLMKQASARPLHPTLLSKQWRSNQSSISSEAAAASGSDSHPDFDQEMTDKPYFISDPSLALYSLARCSDRYPGLDGFLTLGLDPSPNSDSSNPLPADVSRVCENPTERLVGGPECWRPGSSLRECADDHLVTDIMSSRLFGSPSPVSRSSQAASPTKKMGFSGGTEARPRSGRNTPRSARPVSAGLSPQATPWASPQPRPQSSPWPRPRSRAAQEIQEIECVARGDIEDQLLEEEADLLALASLEKELRRMSGKGTALGDPQGVSPPYPRAEVETRRVRGGPKRWVSVGVEKGLITGS